MLRSLGKLGYDLRGIGSEYTDLLEAAGVDTVPELRQRNANALDKTLVKTNAEKHVVRKMPTAIGAVVLLFVVGLFRR